jgi:hypothetical protein
VGILEQINDIQRSTMPKSVLIKDTTREQRINIVKEGLSFCAEGTCDMCSGYSMGVGSIEAMYQPYIDGEMELSEINMAHAAKRFTLGGGRTNDQDNSSASSCANE